MCRHYAEDFGLDVRIGRFHNVFGPKDPEGLLGPYGLGPHRSLDDFWDFSGLQWPSRVTDDDAKRGVEPSGV